MMDPSGINNFEDQWKRALQEASETPPQSVWEGIEAHLDQQDNGRITPLWWKSAKIWYAAASVAALLLAGGIWYKNEGTTQENSQVQIAANQNTKKATANGEVAEGETKNEATGNENAPVIAGNRVAIQSTNEDPDANKKADTKLGATENVTETLGNVGSLASKRSKIQGEQYAGQSSSDKNEREPGSALLPEWPYEKTGIVKEVPAVIAAVTEPVEKSISAQLLTGLPYSDLDVHLQKRYVFFRPEVASQPTEVETVKKKEYWAGLSLMPASFNPDVKLKEAPMAFAAQSLSNKKSVTGSSEAGASYAVQTQGGVRISKHWSMEFGVSYLKGNSSYLGGGYVLSAYNSQKSNVLESAVSPAYGSKNADFINNGALYIDVDKKVSNNYQYLQLPLQAGFTLNPEGKLSYSVLGGLMANFFLSNELESASGDIIKTTALDEVYRDMNWAATTGLRFNYKLSSKWKASLTGSYQKAVSSGFRANQSLDSHPYLYGVSWGVRYSF
jgi:hypothetical protein